MLAVASGCSGSKDQTTVRADPPAADGSTLAGPKAAPLDAGSVVVFPSEAAATISVTIDGEAMPRLTIASGIFGATQDLNNSQSFMRPTCATKAASSQLAIQLGISQAIGDYLILLEARKTLPTPSDQEIDQRVKESQLYGMNGEAALAAGYPTELAPYLSEDTPAEAVRRAGAVDALLYQQMFDQIFDSAEPVINDPTFHDRKLLEFVKSTIGRHKVEVAGAGAGGFNAVEGLTIALDRSTCMGGAGSDRGSNSTSLVR